MGFKAEVQKKLAAASGSAAEAAVEEKAVAADTEAALITTNPALEAGTEAVCPSPTGLTPAEAIVEERSTLVQPAAPEEKTPETVEREAVSSAGNEATPLEEVVSDLAAVAAEAGTVVREAILIAQEPEASGGEATSPIGENVGELAAVLLEEAAATILMTKEPEPPPLVPPSLFMSNTGAATSWKEVIEGLCAAAQAPSFLRPSEAQLECQGRQVIAAQAVYALVPPGWHFAKCNKRGCRHCGGPEASTSRVTSESRSIAFRRSVSRSPSLGTAVKPASPLSRTAEPQIALQESKAESKTEAKAASLLSRDRRRSLVAAEEAIRLQAAESTVHPAADNENGTPMEPGLSLRDALDATAKATENTQDQRHAECESEVSNHPTPDADSSKHAAEQARLAVEAAKIRLNIEEDARKEAEDARVQQAEEAMRIEFEREASQQANAAACIRAEAAALEKVAEQARGKAEDEDRLVAEAQRQEEADARFKSEEAARIKAEEEVKQLTEEARLAELAREQAVEEARKLKAQLNAKIVAEEKNRKAEQHARVEAETAAQKLAEEAARRQKEEEAWLIAEQARLRAVQSVEAARLKVEEDAILKREAQEKREKEAHLKAEADAASAKAIAAAKAAAEASLAEAHAHQKKADADAAAAKVEWEEAVAAKVSADKMAAEKRAAAHQLADEAHVTNVDAQEDPGTDTGSVQSAAAANAAEEAICKVAQSAPIIESIIESRAKSKWQETWQKERPKIQAMLSEKDGGPVDESEEAVVGKEAELPPRAEVTKDSGTPGDISIAAPDKAEKTAPIEVQAGTPPEVGSLSGVVEAKCTEKAPQAEAVAAFQLAKEKGWPSAHYEVISQAGGRAQPTATEEAEAATATSGSSGGSLSLSQRTREDQEKVCEEAGVYRMAVAAAVDAEIAGVKRSPVPPAARPAEEKGAVSAERDTQGGTADPKPAVSPPPSGLPEAPEATPIPHAAALLTTPAPQPTAPEAKAVMQEGGTVEEIQMAAGITASAAVMEAGGQVKDAWNRAKTAALKAGADETEASAVAEFATLPHKMQQERDAEAKERQERERQADESNRRAVVNADRRVADAMQSKFREDSRLLEAETEERAAQLALERASEAERKAKEAAFNATFVVEHHHTELTGDVASLIEDSEAIQHSKADPMSEARKELAEAELAERRAKEAQRIADEAFCVEERARVEAEAEAKFAAEKEAHDAQIKAQEEAVAAEAAAAETAKEEAAVEKARQKLARKAQKQAEKKAHREAELHAFQQATEEAQRKVEEDAIAQAAAQAAMESANPAAALLELTPDEQASALALMPFEDRAALLAGMEPEDRIITLAAAIGKMAPQARREALAAMSDAERAEAISIEAEGLSEMPPGEVAVCLARMSPEQRAEALAALSPEAGAKGIASMDASDRAATLEAMPAKAVGRALAAVEPEEAALLLEDLQEEQRGSLLESLTPEQRDAAAAAMASRRRTPDVSEEVSETDSDSSSSSDEKSPSPAASTTEEEVEDGEDYAAMLAEREARKTGVWGKLQEEVPEEQEEPELELPGDEEEAETAAAALLESGIEAAASVVEPEPALPPRRPTLRTRSPQRRGSALEKQAKAVLGQSLKEKFTTRTQGRRSIPKGVVSERTRRRLEKERRQAVLDSYGHGAVPHEVR